MPETPLLYIFTAETRLLYIFTAETRLLCYVGNVVTVCTERTNVSIIYPANAAMPQYRLKTL